MFPKCCKTDMTAKKIAFNINKIIQTRPKNSKRSLACKNKCLWYLLKIISVAKKRLSIERFNT